jgi:hypothetical protein
MSSENSCLYWRLHTVCDLAEESQDPNERSRDSFHDLVVAGARLRNSSLVRLPNQAQTSGELPNNATGRCFGCS